MSPLIALAFLLTFPMPPQSMATAPPTSPSVAVNSPEIAGSLPCFFQTSWNVYSQAYVGNGTTHDSGTNQWRFGNVTYNTTGSNYFIFDGPLFYVGSDCQATKISFVVAKPDALGSHFLCQIPGDPLPPDSSNTSCTVVANCLGNPPPLVCKGKCTINGEVCTGPIDNTYDVGLYCVGGPCTFGQLYAETGPLNVTQFFQTGTHDYRVDLALHFAGGGTTLPAGEYAIGMATNCDDGSGGGAVACGGGKGEGGNDGSNGGAQPPVVKAGTELLTFKYFTGGRNSTKCLLYDPLHDNSIGLPPTLTFYDAGGCTTVQGLVQPRVYEQAPHIINYVIWSDQ